MSNAHVEQEGGHCPGQHADDATPYGDTHLQIGDGQPIARGLVFFVDFRRQSN
jgi:hypothetical protein